MHSKKYQLLMYLVVIASTSFIISAGCAQTGENFPVSNGISRSQEFFPLVSDHIFGNITAPAFSVDLATAVRGHGWGADWGDPVAMHGLFWTAAVAQQLQPGYQHITDPTVLSFRWLTIPAHDPVLTPGPYPVMEIIPEVTGENFRTPHVDAINYIHVTPNEIFHEVAVCYRFTDTQHGDADVGVYRMRFRAEDLDPSQPWPTGEPYWVDNYVVPDPVNELGQEIACNDFFPDVAYDPYTSDIYLVWTRQMNYAPYSDPSRFCVHFTRFERDEFGMDGHWGLPGSPWLAHSVGHNGWTARVDVGTTPSMYGVPEGTNVVVAYTSQYAADHLGFHTRVNMWAAGDDGDHNLWDLDLEDPAFNDKNAGLPSVDISPELNPTHYVVIGFIQNRAPVGQRWGVTLWDTVSENFHNVIPGTMAPQCLYPSVAVHFEDEIGAPRRVSTSFLMSDTINAWRPFARWYNVDTHALSSNLTSISGGAAGYWDFSQLFDYAWGTNSALTVFPGQQYWVAWSDTVGEGGFPIEVQGTHGWTD